jgi:hypothetical protein
MESLTQLVTDSLTRHNFHLAVDPARLQWSPWFRCHSAASLLAIPSQPGIVALAEAHMGSAGCPAEPSSASAAPLALTLLQFTASDDMAYTVDRVFTQPSLLRLRLASGRCHFRYVVMKNESERRNIAATLNQALLDSAQKSATTPAVFSFLDLMFDSRLDTILDTTKDQPQSGERVQPTA